MRTLLAIVVAAVLAGAGTYYYGQQRAADAAPPPEAPVAHAPAPDSPVPVGTGGGPLDPSVEKILAEIKKADTGQLAVSEEDGRFLRFLIASRGVKRALEIGGASGYSAIWMGQALRATGGTLVTIEYEPERAKELAANISRAGLDDIVIVVSGDAFEKIPALPGTFDFVFLDAWKKDYQRFFELVYPRLEPRGLFVAHNVVNKRDEMEDFLKTIDEHPALWTTVVSPSSEGMSVSIKMR